MQTQKYIARIVALLIGIVFLLSGLSKNIDSDSFIGTLFQYGFGMFSYVAPLISPVEVILGVCLLLNYRVRTAAFVVFILTLVFTIAFLFAHFVRGVEDCGCFGDWLQLSPTVAILKNVLIMSGALFIIFKNATSSQTRSWQVAVISIFAAFSFALSGYTVDKSLSTALSINTLEGKKLQETSLSVLSSKVTAKRYACFIFSPSCPHCWNATENIKSIKESGLYEDVIGVVADSRESNLEIYKQQMKPNFDILILKEDKISESVGMRVPKLLIIEDGIITKVFQGGEIPCPQLIGK